MRFTVKDVLRMEVAPALGCTEPGAVALGAAAAAALLEGAPITSIEVWVDPNVYKNGIAVAIPDAPGVCGLDAASALGALGGDPSRKLQVLETVDEAAFDRAIALRDAGAVTVSLLANQPGPYVRTVIHALQNERAHTAESVIFGAHDTVISLVLDGVPVAPATATAAAPSASLGALEAWLQELTLAQLVALVDDLDDEDFAFLQEGVDLNLHLAKHGLRYGSGLGIGSALERMVDRGTVQRDMITAAKILASAAADARMDGVCLPAMSSAGSGNHGLTAILPIWAVKPYAPSHLATDRRVLEAIALSHIVTGFVKAYTGRLSALCGCSVAAGAGATAGIAYLLGGDLDGPERIEAIAGAIENLMGDLAGMICDGAKAGCALKLATAAGAAVQAALLSLEGVRIHPTNGIIDASPEGTMRNVGTLSTQGMLAADQTILAIMLAKQLH